jgi:hypothetical protein
VGGSAEIERQIQQESEDAERQDEFDRLEARLWPRISTARLHG